MIKIKICGLKFKEDIEFLNNFPVDYMGFIMYPKSPRFVGKELKNLLSIVKKAKKVVVFVNPAFDEVKKCLDYGADFIQLHGEEPLAFAQKIGLKRVIKAFRIKDDFNLSFLKLWENCHAILLDTYVKDLPGGTGKSFDWEIAKNAVNLGYKIFLAGGLNPENIISAIKIVSPYAIDISSGVEAFPGKKDSDKIKKLFENLSSLI